MNKVLAAISLVVGSLISASVVAQTAASNYPDKPIRVVVPFPPGGPVDTLARLMADKAGNKLGQPMIVENRAGAGGSIGAAAVARSEPDGYTLLIVASSYAMDPAIRSNLPFNPRDDLKGFYLLATGPVILLAHPSVQANTSQELVRLIKDNPGKFSYASTGVGTVNHFAGEMFKQATQTDALHVPYSGAAPATQAILAGEVHYFFNNVLSSIPHIKSGKVKPLAVTSAERWPAVPDVPTLKEAGIDGVELSSWYGFLVPAGTPENVQDKLSEAFDEALRDAEVSEKIAQLGLATSGMKRADFHHFIEQEIDKWTSVAQKANIKAE